MRRRVLLSGEAVKHFHLPAGEMALCRFWWVPEVLAWFGWSLRLISGDVVGPTCLYKAVGSTTGQAACSAAREVVTCSPPAYAN